MTVLYVLVAILIACVLALTAVIVLSINRVSKVNLSKKDIVENNGLIKDSIESSIKYNNSVLNAQISNQGENVKRLEERLDRFMNSNVDSFNKLRDSMSANMQSIQNENTHQLDEMRKTVNEKLTENLDNRFNQSFKMISDRLLEINSTFNALQGLQTDVNDLGKIFKNVKTRGTWGELSLDSLLSEVLTDEQYVKQLPIKTDDENGRVDFAIKLPGQGDGLVYLPIDAKFPLEDYERLIDASNSGNVEDVDKCAKALNDAVLKQAKSIKEKYVQPPKTTDFAIMYVPIEGLYAEVVKSSDLLYKLQKDYQVVICGPTTLSALLNSLRMGFKSVAIEKKSKEIANLLEKFQNDFRIFNNYLNTLKERMNAVQKSVEDATKKSESIGKTLAKVTKIELPANDMDLLSDLAKDDGILCVNYIDETTN